MKKTKIVCTMGPSTDKPGIIEKLIEKGMNVARFNFSHGCHEEHAKRINMVRAASKKVKRVVALMLDTKGPEMRLGKFSEGKVELIAGKTLILTSDEILGDVTRVSVNHKRLPQEVKIGDKILLSDGLVGLEVLEVKGNDIITKILNSGAMSDRKRVAVPGVHISLPPVSEQDEKDILFGVAEGMDFIAASFIQQASDVIAIRKIVEQAGGHMHIIAKIENAKGVENIDEILKVVDGVMVARGDLGVEIPTEDVPLIQKQLIKKCNSVGKPVITATQMLESMSINPRPTRAEASDVANAIMDGTDAIMLSGETASGMYPVEAVATMAQIARRVEEDFLYDETMVKRQLAMEITTTEAVSNATVHIASNLDATAILTLTETGYTPRMVSKYRPQSIVVAVTPHEKIIRQMQLNWGVYPILAPISKNSDELVETAVVRSLEEGLIAEGDLVVITAGLPIGSAGSTNMTRVHIVGNVILKGTGIGKNAVTGKACIIKTAEDFKNFKDGDILVAYEIDEVSSRYATKASAIITEEGGLTSGAAILGVSYNIPTVVGAEGAINKITKDMLITVDAERGVVYKGHINAR